MELPVFLLFLIQQHPAEYVTTSTFDSLGKKNVKTESYYKFGTYQIVDEPTHVWLSALTTIKCNHSLGISCQPKNTTVIVNIKFHPLPKPYLYQSILYHLHYPINKSPLHLFLSTSF